MNGSRRNLLGLTVVLFGALAVVSSPAAAFRLEPIQRSFDVGPGGHLVLVTDRGSIRVEGTGGNRVEVEIIPSVKTSDKAHAEKLLDDLTLDFDQNGHDVSVEARLKNKGLSWFKKSKLQLEFRVRVPRAYNVNLKTSGGSIAVEDLQGDTMVNTSGGSLSFARLDGPVRGKTSGGSIRLEGCSGDADVSTSGGSIKLRDVGGDVHAATSGGSLTIEQVRGQVNAKTSGGSITVSEILGAVNATTSGGSIKASMTERPDGDCRLETSGGNIAVTVDNGVGITIDARTSSDGEVRSDLPVTVQGRIEKDSLRGSLNGGGPELVLRTSGGNVYIR